jgi:outer membrane biogenesis lipoprotein LolB
LSLRGWTGSGVGWAAFKNTVISPQQEKTLRYDWFPIPGKHVLSLLTPQGLLLDQVSFEVRGATLVANKKTGQR